MPAKQAGRGEAGSAALAEDGEAARGHPQAVHPAHVHPLKEQHEQTSAPRFNPGPGGGSEQGDAGRLPEAPCQVAGLLHHQLGGDDAQVQGQQLVALHHLCLLVLAVVAQQLPGEGGNWGVLQGMAQPAGDGSAKPPPFGSASPRKPLPRTSLQPQDRSPRLCGTQHRYPPAAPSQQGQTRVPSSRAGGCRPVVVSCQHPDGSGVVGEDGHLHHLQLVALGTKTAEGRPVPGRRGMGGLGCCERGSAPSHPSYQLVLEPEEVGAAVVAVLQHQGGVALLQVSPGQRHQGPDLGDKGHPQAEPQQPAQRWPRSGAAGPHPAPTLLLTNSARGPLPSSELDLSATLRDGAIICPAVRST